jgi:hypothetical protein
LIIVLRNIHVHGHSMVSVSTMEHSVALVHLGMVVPETEVTEEDSGCCYVIAGLQKLKQMIRYICVMLLQIHMAVYQV